jgi:hypothetical protein
LIMDGTIIVDGGINERIAAGIPRFSGGCKS